MKLTALRFFLGGIENYIIAPTAWYYVRSFGQSKFFLALVLISFNIGAIIAGPLFGFLTDRFGNPRFIFICSNVLKFVASVMYSINLSPYFPLFARLITGLDGGLAILGQIALQIDEESRGKSFLFFEGVYCLGSAVSPGIGSFISFRTNILGWDINEGNSPGIVLAIVWLLFLIFSLFLPGTMWVETGTRIEELNFNISAYEDEKRSSEYDQDGDQRLSEDYSSEKKPRIMWDSRMFCLLFLIFTNMGFSSTSTFYAPILALDHLHLKLIHTKLIFLNCTIFTLLAFTCFHLASRYVEERKLFAIALLMQLFSISFLTYLAFSWGHVTDVQYYILLLYVCLGMPYFAYPFGNSILSKITDPQFATRIQGLSLAIIHVSFVICRVVVSFVFTKTSLIYFCFALIILWLVGIIWYGMLYKRMALHD